MCAETQLNNQIAASASCINGNGDDYVGTVAVTENGRFCQRWDMQYPHTHSYTNSDMFPEGLYDSQSKSYCQEHQHTTLQM